MSKEINLLPLPRRRQLARRFFERELRKFCTSLLLGVCFVTAVGVGAFVVLTVTMSILFPVPNNELETAVVEYRAETRVIQARNESVHEMLRQQAERLTWSGYLPDIFASLPVGTQIQILSGSRESRQVTLRGQAAARSALIVLENKLKALPWVKEVISPPANLLERFSPEFSLTLRL